MARDSATQILDIAERRIRQAGYNAVSFRDIAGEMGIKSASLHYHFPKKEDLGEAMVKRYAANFWAALRVETASLTDPKECIRTFIRIYRKAYQAQNLICLCAVLGAEASGLPQKVAQEVGVFFTDNINWLKEQFELLNVNTPTARAKSILALLEGAMIVGSVNGDISIFDAVEGFAMTGLE